MKQIIHDQDFADALICCKKNNLYLGLGNPMADILIVGKEYHHNYNTDKSNLEELRAEIEAKEKKEV